MKSNVINCINDNSNNFPSIFCLIDNKPNEIEYPVNSFFTNFKLDEICYPIENKSPIIGEFPEKEALMQAMKKCLDQSSEGKILLVSGDLSGIQDTVYTISSKGALKTLRARSFMLELLCEHICFELTQSMFNKESQSYKILSNHVVFSGGGSFCLVLPDNSEVIQSIQKFKMYINDWAFREFTGKLYIAMAWQSVPNDELNDTQKFRKNWESLVDSLENDKQRKFNWRLGLIFSEESIKEPTLKTNAQECQICHLDDVEFKNKPMRVLNKPKVMLDSVEKLKIAENDGNIIVHDLCYQLYYLGDDLTEFDRIYRSNTLFDCNHYLTFPGIDNKPIYYTLQTPNKDYQFSWIFNKETDNDSLPFFYANYVRTVAQLPQRAIEQEKKLYFSEHQRSLDKPYKTTANFTGLAYAACGADFIGCLRMDVDNLGKVFSEKLQEFTLVNLAHLSKMMNIFFKVYLNKICAGQLNLPDKINSKATDLTNKHYYYENEQKLPDEQKEAFRQIRGAPGRNVSIVYAGGDDLFIVGAWDELTELAYDIQRCFARFCGLGISGGLTLHHPKYPLYQMAKLSGETEKEAKSFKLFDEQYEPPKKNKFTPFYSPYFKYKSASLTDKSRRSDDPNYPADKLIYTIPWDNELHQEIVDKFVALCEWEDDRLKLKQISRRFIYKLFRLAEVWWEQNTLYVPQFIYLTGRIHQSLKNNPELRRQFNELKDLIFKMPLKNNEHKSIRFLKISLTWIDLYQRRKGEQDA